MARGLISSELNKLTTYKRVSVNKINLTSKITSKLISLCVCVQLYKYEYNTYKNLFDCCGVLRVAGCCGCMLGVVVEVPDQEVQDEGGLPALTST